MHAARSSVALSRRIVACNPEVATDREASEIDALVGEGLGAAVCTSASLARRQEVLYLYL